MASSESVESAVSVKLRLPSGERVKQKQLFNISLGGLFIEMEEPLAFGSEVQLELEMPQQPHTIRCGGFVVWTTKTSPAKAPGHSGMAVRLTNIGISEMRRIAEQVAVQLPSGTP